MTKLLTYINALDQRSNYDDIKVLAWIDALKDTGMEYQWAQNAVKNHYLQYDDMLTITILTEKWWEKRNRDREKARKAEILGASEKRCPRSGCICPHDKCHKGWIDNDRGTTAPCVLCKPGLADIIEQAPQPEYREPGELSHTLTHPDRKDAFWNGN